jgi:hypothetical protein
MLFEDLALNSVILELRYDEGHLYWDTCGEMILDIQRISPEWRWDGVSTELAKLKNLRRNMELMFNYSYIRLIQNEVDNLNQFKESVEKITPRIVEKFKIEKFNRIGNRYQYVLPLKNPEQGKKIVRDSTLIEVSEEKLALFGKDSTKTSFVLHIENKNLHYRVELISIERIAISRNIKVNERFNPKYGLRIDVDIAIINEIKSSDFNYSDFIQANNKFLEYNLVKLIQK